MRKPRVLWANYYCLLDTSSGASISVRQILRQLHKRGIDVKIVGATVFDAENGAKTYRDLQHQLSGKSFFAAEDGELTHELMVTASIIRKEMSTGEINRWFSYYRKTLDEFKPDLVFFYGGNSPDFLITNEANTRGIPSVAYLCNGNYFGTRWCRDVDLIVTDSQATAEMYQQRNGLMPVACGKFIDDKKVVAKHPQRQHILFVNPKIEKGALIVVLIAMRLQELRPDITIEVLESRGNWADTIERLRETFGDKLDKLMNVTVTPTTHDMRPVYGRTKLVLQPSLWWESGSRVLAEAMLNGIPAIVSERAGGPEMVGNGGIKVKLPESCYESPYNQLPEQSIINSIVDRIMLLYDDDNVYQQLCANAKQVGQQVHSIERSTDRLLAALQPLLAKQAGDNQFSEILTAIHKQL